MNYAYSMYYTGIQSGVPITEAPSILCIQYYNGLPTGVLIVEAPLYYGYSTTQNDVFITEVSSIQWTLTTLQYYTGLHSGVLIIETPSTQRSVKENDGGVLITEATDWCPYYRGSLHTVHIVLHWDTE